MIVHVISLVAVVENTGEENNLIFASVDIGSNSVRHLVVEENNGRLHYLSSSSQITRITEGIREGNTMLLDHAVSRTLNALSKVIKELDHYGISCENRFLFATESLRAASNSHAVIRRIEEVAGIHLDVLSGEEEARRSFRGAVSSFGCDSVVFDLGGGSLEICTSNGGISFPLGAVRMTNMFGHDSSGLRDYVRAALNGLDIGSDRRIVGLGGTSSSIAMMLKRIPVEAYSPSLIHGSEIKHSDLINLATLFRKPLTERIGVIGLDPRRADIILAGIVTITTLVEFLEVSSYIHSETDLLWGTIIEILEERTILFEEISFQ